MTDKLNITIRIAELPPFALEIKRDDEAAIRKAEYNVNRLWRSWSAKFTDKTSHEVLGMVAFQFAKLFTVLNKRQEDTLAAIEKFENDLDKILLDEKPI